MTVFDVMDQCPEPHEGYFVEEELTGKRFLVVQRLDDDLYYARVWDHENLDTFAITHESLKKFTTPFFLEATE